MRTTSTRAGLFGFLIRPGESSAEAKVVPETDEPAPLLFGNEASTDECLSIIREIAAEQRERNPHLDTKAASIAAFAGTALTLSLTLGRPVLQQHFTTATWAHSAIRGAFISSATLLGLAAAVALLGVLAPAPTKDLDERAIDSYADAPKVVTPPAELRETWLQTMAQMTLADRVAGDTKARRSKLAVWLLVLGIGGLLAQAFVLGIAT